MTTTTTKTRNSVNQRKGFTVSTSGVDVANLFDIGKVERYDHERFWSKDGFTRLDDNAMVLLTDRERARVFKYATGNREFDSYKECEITEGVTGQAFICNRPEGHTGSHIAVSWCGHDVLVIWD